MTWIQDQETKKLKGRKKLKDFRSENKNIGGYLVRNSHRKRMQKLPDKEFKYLERYIAESGF